MFAADLWTGTKHRD